MQRTPDPAPSWTRQNKHYLLGCFGLALAIAGFRLCIAGADLPLMEVPLMEEAPSLKEANSLLPEPIRYVANLGAVLALLALIFPWQRLLLLVAGAVLGLVGFGGWSLYDIYSAGRESLQNNYERSRKSLESSVDENTSAEEKAEIAKEVAALKKPSDVFAMNKVRRGGFALGGGAAALIIGSMLAGGASRNPVVWNLLKNKAAGRRSREEPEPKV